MREFKFRVFDKLAPCMANVQQISFSKEEVSFINNGTSQPCRSFDSVVLMQCTGLKDKNSKEIYEGDLLKWEWERNYHDVMTPSDWEVHILKVEFKDGSFQAVDIDDPKSLDEMAWEVAGQSEIIGNIYQNEDLITV